MRLKRYWITNGTEVSGPFSPGELRDLYATGQIGDAHDACEDGTENWMRAMDLLEDLRIVAPPVPQPLIVVVPKIKRSSGGCTAFVLLLLGVLCLLTCNPFGLVLGVLLLIGAHYAERAHYTCGSCGNRVEQSSRLCPTCRSSLN